MKHKLLLSFLLITSLSTFAVGGKIIWKLDNLSSIDGNEVTVYGNPEVVYTTNGEPAGIVFNPFMSTTDPLGAGDRIQVKSNPLNGASEFTVEMIFTPFETAVNLQPRVFHICRPDSASNATRTMTLETRYSTTTTWYPDFFIKSVMPSAQMPALSIPTDHFWIHLAMSYKNGVMKGYVDGDSVCSYTGTTYTGLPSSAEVSLGGRMNNKNYFKGVIKALIFTSQAIEPADFTRDVVFPFVNEHIASDILKVVGSEIQNPTKLTVEVYSVFGAKLISSSEESIPIKDLPSGVYIAVSSQGSLKFIR